MEPPRSLPCVVPGAVLLIDAGWVSPARADVEPVECSLESPPVVFIVGYPVCKANEESEGLSVEASL